VETRVPVAGGKDQSARGQGSGSETSGVAKLGRRREDRRATGSALSHRNDLEPDMVRLVSAVWAQTAPMIARAARAPARSVRKRGHAEALNSQR